MTARDNPFATHRIEAVRLRPTGWDWPTLMARLRSLDWRGAIVGPEGSGKTRLLEALAERVPDAAGRPARLVRLGPDAPGGPGQLDAALADPAAGSSVLLLDGADALGRWRWRAVRRRARRCGGLIVTAHRPGRLATLVECRTNPELLGELVAELLGPDAAAAPQPADLDALFARHGGNVRTALLELYDRHDS